MTSIPTRQGLNLLFVMMLFLGMLFAQGVTNSMSDHPALIITQANTLDITSISVTTPIQATKPAPSFSRQSVNLLYPDQYHGMAKLEEELLLLNETFPDLVELKVIGHTWQNRSIWVMIITNEEIPNTQKSNILLVAEHHAREIITTEVSLRFILDLLNNFATNPDAQYLLNHIVIHYIPVLNPDGYEEVVTNEHYWQRKNGRPIDDDGDGLVDEDPLDNPNFCGYYGCSGTDNDGDGLVDEDPVGGVDLNRNYDFHWGDCPSSSTCNGDADEPTSSQTYPGDGPFSEPETRAYRDYVSNLTIAAALSYHSGTNATLFPWGYPGLGAPPDQPIFDTIREQLKFYLPPSYWTGSVGYGVAGEWGDWQYATHGTITCTIEVYGNDDANDIYHLFNPDPSGIIPLHEELIDFEYYWLSLAPILNTSIEIGKDKELHVRVSNLSPALSTFDDINATFTVLSGPSINDVNIIAFNPNASQAIPASTTTEYFVVVKAATSGTYTLEITIGNEWTGRFAYQVQVTLGNGSLETNDNLSTTSNNKTSEALPTGTVTSFYHYLVLLSLGTILIVRRQARRKNDRKSRG